MPLESRPDRRPEPVHGHQRPEREDRRDGGSDDFFGLDVDAVSPRAQVAASLAVLIPVAELSAGNGKERELLEALRERGELTPAEAAMETSLSVAGRRDSWRGGRGYGGRCACYHLRS